MPPRQLSNSLLDNFIFDKWVNTCPLHYTSPNASSVRDVLGTLMLGILSGSRRSPPWSAKQRNSGYVKPSKTA